MWSNPKIYRESISFRHKKEKIRKVHNKKSGCYESDFNIVVISCSMNAQGVTLPCTKHLRLLGQ